MNWGARARFLHRAWRYRLRSEKFGIAFLLSRDLRGRTAVDIGVNRGIYSYWMSGCVGKAGRVVAFEPQPELAAVLRNLRVAFGLHQIEIADYRSLRPRMHRKALVDFVFVPKERSLGRTRP